MSNYDSFELRCQSDSLVYTFDRIEKGGSPAYRRRDADLWISFRRDFGWCAWDDEMSTLMGRSWEILPENQNIYPPEGIWVSRKNEKSYVYELKYL